MNNEELARKFAEVNDDRFQHQPWYVKAWRLRWYMAIPIWTLRLAGKYWVAEDEEGFPISYERVGFHAAWRMAIGEAQMEMKWYYTSEEVFGEDWGEEPEDDEETIH